MADFDLFNGDADGIFSLIQLRKADPRPNAERVTGVKRDIKLFPLIAERVQAGDRITALDISMAKNIPGLQIALSKGASVFYCDHHQTGDIPEHENLHAITDLSPVTCTAYLIDQYLEQAHTGWAVCGAYGDNFNGLAEHMADGRNLPLSQLRELGELVNYNAYGLTTDDLHFHPSELYEKLMAYDSPVDFLEDNTDTFRTLRDGYVSDWEIAQGAREMDVSDVGQVLCLPDSPASNRISGLFGNALVDEDPMTAFAILTELTHEKGYRISIRAPRKTTARTAGDLASDFGGGGRVAAAGIDLLPEAELPKFIEAFRAAFVD